MQLVPLSPGGRVAVVVTAPLRPGPLQVALRVNGEAVVIEALGPTRADPGGSPVRGGLRGLPARPRPGSPLAGTRAPARPSRLAPATP